MIYISLILGWIEEPEHIYISVHPSIFYQYV